MISVGITTTQLPLFPIQEPIAQNKKKKKKRKGTVHTTTKSVKGHLLAIDPPPFLWNLRTSSLNPCSVSEMAMFTLQYSAEINAPLSTQSHSCYPKVLMLDHPTTLKHAKFILYKIYHCKIIWKKTQASVKRLNVGFA